VNPIFAAFLLKSSKEWGAVLFDAAKQNRDPGRIMLPRLTTRHDLLLFSGTLLSFRVHSDLCSGFLQP
jgi:hypothetical protein